MPRLVARPVESTPAAITTLSNLNSPLRVFKTTSLAVSTIDSTKEDSINNLFGLTSEVETTSTEISFLEKTSNNFDKNPLDCKLKEEINYNFYHSESQKKLIQTYFNQYGRNDIGLGRIVLRANMNRLHRSVISNENEKFEPVDEEYNKRQKEKLIA